MENTSTSITIPNSLNQLSSTGEGIYKANINKNHTVPTIMAVVLLSLFAINGSPATTKNTNLNEFSSEKTVSVSDFRNMEEQYKKGKYFYITENGFGENDMLIFENFI